MMKAAMLPALLGAIVFGAFGCGKEQPPAAPAKAASQPGGGRGTYGRSATGTATTTTGPAKTLDTRPTYTIGRSLTLWRIGELRYGSGQYADLIMLHNNLKDAAQLPIGRVIKTPELKAILVEEKLCPLMEEEVDSLLAARAAYLSVENLLQDAHRAAGRGTMTLPPEVKEKLLEAAQDADHAAAGFSQQKPGVVAIPAKAVAQMKSFADALRKLASGKCNESGGDIDLVHQHLARALANAILWARNGYK
jgi:hypothetical protein